MEQISSLSQTAGEGKNSKSNNCIRSETIALHEEKLFVFLKRVYGPFCSVEEAFTDAVIRWWKETDSLEEVQNVETLYKYAVEAAENLITGTALEPFADASQSSLTADAASDDLLPLSPIEQSLRFLPLEYRLVTVLVDVLGFSRELAGKVVERELEETSQILCRARRMIRRNLHRFPSSAASTLSDEIEVISVAQDESEEELFRR